MRSEYMRPFNSFYDPKGLDPPITPQHLQKLELMIAKEIEIALKQVRSSKNLSTKLRKTKHITEILNMQLDLLEDTDCGRYATLDEQYMVTENVKTEVMKIVPENYRIGILPAKFSYTDGERIRRAIID